MTSRSLSAAAVAAAAARETGEELCVLVTIDHDDLATPIRVTPEAPDVVSRGNTYTALPFRVVLPAEREDQLPAPAIQVDNVDRTIVRALRALNSPPTVTLEVVLRSSPNTLEFGPFTAQLRLVPYDAAVIDGQLSVPPILDEEHPEAAYDEANFPGIYP